MRRGLRHAAAIGTVLAAAACAGDDSTTPNTAPTVTASPTSGHTSTTATPAPTTAPGAPIEDHRLHLVEIARLDAPIAAAVRPGDDALWVAERVGRVRRVGRDGEIGNVVVDLTGDVGRITSEQGLLGLAWSPDGGTLVVSYTDGNADGASVIEAIRFERDSAVPRTRWEVLRVAQPYANHNGGHVAFDPDGHLWIGLGDGGGQGDPDNRAQRLDDLHGKLLRIDVTSGIEPYAVPSDNPFAGDSGSRRREIAVLGVRNPWRFSFDSVTGDLWIGDVGGSEWEEIDVLRRADGWRAPDGGVANLGWRVREGFERTTVPEAGDVADDALVAPVWVYDHSQGSSITGGVVVRDPRLADLDGVYLFADWAMPGLRGLRLHDGSTEPEVGRFDTGDDQMHGVVAFVEGPDREVFALSLDGPIWRIDPAG